jgi:hypothetical protein
VIIYSHINKECNIYLCHSRKVGINQYQVLEADDDSIPSLQILIIVVICIVGVLLSYVCGMSIAAVAGNLQYYSINY